MVKVRKTGQARLFTSPILEAFTRTNPLVHVITYGGAMALFLYHSNFSIAMICGYVLIGLIGWTLTEYILHRYLFHSNTGSFQYLIHGVHHEFPRDKERLMMPPIPGLIILFLLTGIWFLILRQYIMPFMAGFTMGYIMYTFIHYIIHAWRPLPGLKFLWSHHHKHHNPVYENKAYGVSSPIWDWIFRTLP